MVERALNVAQKRVAVAGLGIAGFAAADALLELGAQVSIFDASDAEKQKERGQVLEILGAKVYLGFRGELPRDLDLLVVSPGLSPNHPWILDFLKRELPVWGELELAFGA